VNKEFSILDLPLPVERQKAVAFSGSAKNQKSKIENGFTLVEIMVVVALLSLIVLALMAVFDSTQKAFRAGITQTDLLEGSRASLDLMANDIHLMAPSGGNGTNNTDPVNFCVTNNPNNLVMIQPMVPPGNYRTNFLQNFFVLSRGNVAGHDSWIGIGYAVVTNSPSGFYSLYRFETNHPVAIGPAFLFTNDFQHFLTNVTAWSHLIDGVVDLRLAPYDINGQWIATNKYKFVRTNELSYANLNRQLSVNGSGTFPTGYRFYGNLLPASVDIEMGVFEDQELRRADARPVPFDYLTNRSAQVHIFRQRVMIPNVDSTAYKQ
jgi:prepilin-type N-terminal cleavage/methylation domain-containing protein